MVPDLTSRRILVVDDEEPLRNAVAAFVRKRLGCEVVTAGDGEEALARLREQGFDTLVADMAMPGLHGLELIALVRNEWPELDIIVMTGFRDAFPYVDVVQAGAADFIAKPHHAGELEAKLLRLFRERDLRDARAVAEKKYHTLFELSMDGMVLADRDGYKIVEVNRAFCRLSGRSRKQLAGTALCHLVDAHGRGRFEEGLALLAEGGQGAMGDIVMSRPDGREMSLDVSITFLDGVCENMVLLVFRDVTEKREVERQLASVAETDKVTGLGNRRSFDRRLEWAVARAQKVRISHVPAVHRS